MEIPKEPRRNEYPEGNDGGFEWLKNMHIYQKHQIEILEYAINLLPSDIKETYMAEAKTDYRKDLCPS